MELVEEDMYLGDLIISDDKNREFQKVLEYVRLYQFFITQWLNPNRGDWTETVKETMEEYNISIDFEYLKSKSKDSFKKMVKEQENKNAMRILKEKQAKHTKMKMWSILN